MKCGPNEVRNVTHEKWLGPGRVCVAYCLHIINMNCVATRNHCNLVREKHFHPDTECEPWIITCHKCVRRGGGASLVCCVISSTKLHTFARKSILSFLLIFSIIHFHFVWANSIRRHSIKYQNRRRVQVIISKLNFIGTWGISFACVACVRFLSFYRRNSRFSAQSAGSRQHNRQLYNQKRRVSRGKITIIPIFSMSFEAQRWFQCNRRCLMQTHIGIDACGEKWAIELLNLIESWMCVCVALIWYKYTVCTGTTLVNWKIWNFVIANYRINCYSNNNWTQIGKVRRTLDAVTLRTGNMAHARTHTLKHTSIYSKLTVHWVITCQP